MEFLLAIAFVAGVVLWTLLCILFFALVGTIFFGPGAWTYMLRTTNNRRWATLLGVDAVTFIVALCTPGNSLLPSVPGDLWGTLAPVRQKQASGWWRHFWGGDFPTPVLADQGSWYGWFFSLAFWTLFVVWIVYTIPTFSDEIGRFFRWIRLMIVTSVRRHRAAARPAAGAPAAGAIPAAGAGTTRTLLEGILVALGLDFLVPHLRGGGGGGRAAVTPAAHAVGLIGAVLIALMFAIVLRLLLPTPIFTAFAFILFLYVLQRIESQFGTGIRTLKEWGRMFGSAIGALVVFSVLQLLGGRFLDADLSPAVAWDLWGWAGGVKGIFWSPGPVSLFLVRELLFELVAGSLAFAWYKGKGKRSIRTLFTLCFLGVIVQIAFPRAWTALVPTQTAIDRSVAAKGIGKGLADVFNPAPPPIRLICGPGDSYLELSGEQLVVFVPPAQPATPTAGCSGANWSQWLRRPYGSPKFLIEPGGRLDIEFGFSDGSKLFFKNFDPARDVLFPPAKNGRKLTTVRFKNPDPVGVLVRVQLK